MSLKLAIAAFKAAHDAYVHAAHCEKKLNSIVSDLADADMDEYVRATEEYVEQNPMPNVGESMWGQ